MDLNSLTPAERRVWEAYPRGEEVDFRQGEGLDDATRGDAWGPERTVRAEALRAILLGGTPEGAEVPALRVTGSRITGVLNLQYGLVEHAIRLMACHFEQAPNLYGARVHQLNLSGCHLPGLWAATIRVDGVLRLTGCRVTGPVLLGGAQISGSVFLDRATVGEPGHTGEDATLQLNHARIDDDLWAPHLTVHGGLTILGAAVTGRVNLHSAHLSAPDGEALNAGHLTARLVQARSLMAEGMVGMGGAQLAGPIILDDAHLTATDGGTALYLAHCTARSLSLNGAAPIKGGADLRYARFTVIEAAPSVWPGRVAFNGLTYEALDPRLPPAERLAALEHDEDGYVPYAYEQLAAAYRKAGDDAAAREVLLTRQQRLRRTLSWYAKAWGYVQDVTVGYGYRPLRAAGWLLALLAVGAVAFGLHPPRPFEPGKAPHFNAFIYTLNLLLPIVDFGQAKMYNPTGPYQWLSYGLIAAGWILATTIVAGITRAVSRQ